MIVNERLAEYIRTQEVDLPDYLYKMEQQARRDEIPIIRKEAQSLLRFLLCLCKPERILEVGCAVGFSASFMSEYMPQNAHITTIEKDERRIREAKKNLARIPRANDVTLVCGDATTVLADLVAKGESYSFIFMDAAKGQYMSYLPDIMKLLPAGGLFLTDNVLLEGSVAESKYALTHRERTLHIKMREYIYELKHNELLTTVILPVGDGVSLCVKGDANNQSRK